MQIRPHPTETRSMRVWLSTDEQHRVLDYYSEDPRRQLALNLGLHGLRTDEVVSVMKNHFREIDDTDELYKLRIPDSKTGEARETPVGRDLYRMAQIFANSAQKNVDEELVDVGTRQVRRWIEKVRDEFVSESGNDNWGYLSMHDLRRTWATDTYWTLAFTGNPAAEELTMSWGGWAKSETGRATFRQNYLGPVPDHVTKQAAQDLEYLQ